MFATKRVVVDRAIGKNESELAQLEREDAALLATRVEQDRILDEKKRTKRKADTDRKWSVADDAQVLISIQSMYFSSSKRHRARRDSKPKPLPAEVDTSKAVLFQTRKRGDWIRFVRDSRWILGRVESVSPSRVVRVVYSGIHSDFTHSVDDDDECARLKLQKVGETLSLDTLVEPVPGSHDHIIIQSVDSPVQYCFRKWSTRIGGFMKKQGNMNALALPCWNKNDFSKPCECAAK